MTQPINEWDDSLDMPAPCQPIGCDNGYHVPGCFYEVVVVDHWPVKPPYGTPERAAWDRENGGAR